ncbi:hypothetical protein GF337_16490 [candidate division KSB1 bacterium]|nr:hypothetical protein [candidate division KSB1 bacterium]
MAERALKIPTILITGFLGAGKTTLLNRLIEYYQSRRTVLLINEFGKIGIDGELLISGNYEKIELNKGSLFCICVRTDFISEVEKIATEMQPELLIIEATGLADTSEMEKMLALPNIKDYIELIACLCLVDSQNFLKIKDNLKAPASQIRSADLVIINKIDLVDKQHLEKVTRAVREISSSVPVIEMTYADFPLEAFAEIHRPESGAGGAPGEGRPDPLTSVTLEEEGSFSQESWDEFRINLDVEIMRAKGFVHIDDHCYFVEATMNDWRFQPVDDRRGDKNRLVLIGRGLDEDRIGELFREELRLGN